MLPFAMNSEQCASIVAACCSLLVFSLRCEAQNLVPNPSFEEFDTCPYTIGFQEGDRPLHWMSYLESPEYFNACAGSLGGIDTLVGVPQNGWGYQYAWDGDAYSGFYAATTTSDNFREYIGAQLLQPLVVGQAYYVSFRTNAAATGSYWFTGGVCNNIGLLFTMHSNVWEGLNSPTFQVRNYAHVYTSTVVSDTAGWTLVSGIFTADSAYQYVVLGNFFDNAHTELVTFEPGTEAVVYYFVDEVCVSASPSGCAFTGIEETYASTQATAIVDPHSVELVVAWPGHQRFTVDLFDMSGRVIRQSCSQHVSIQGLSAGPYVARIREGAEFAFIKFVKPR